MADWALLIGNGFSRAYDDDAFRYDALREAAKFPERLSAVFETLGSSDFEDAMRRLHQAYELLPLYNVPVQYRSEFRKDINLVRSSLVYALRQHHLEGAHELDAVKSKNCASFLSGFSSIFTLNYDLLLYWVFLEHLSQQHTDGFGGNPIRWLDGNGQQSVYYLHGALHLYDDGQYIRKLTYNGGRRILEQLDTNITAGKFPLFVSEGESRQKLARIRSNAYLLHAYNSLSANALPLCLYGFSFGSQDRHIINAIARSRTPKITVVLHAGSPTKSQQRICYLASALAQRIITSKGTSAQCNFLFSDKVAIW